MTIVLYTFLGIAAVIGLYTVIVAIGQLCLPLRQISVALRIETKEDAERLDILLCEARRSLLRRGGSHVEVLMAEELIPDQEREREMLVRFLEDNRATLYSIGKEEVRYHAGRGNTADG